MHSRQDTQESHVLLNGARPSVVPIGGAPEAHQCVLSSTLKDSHKL
jgi:hypothetical protein